MRQLRRFFAGRAMLAVTASVLLSACSQQQASDPEADLSGRIAEGNIKAGARTITLVGCGTCHTIPGISGANGMVGPPLDQIGRRIYLAGLLRNTPDNMIVWLREPQRVLPGNAMPNMGLSEEQARDITAYLYTLR